MRAWFKCSKALESTGVHGFLGCPSVLYEKDLESFFSNATVHGDSVISCVQSKFVGISEELFAGSFALPTEGLTSMDEVPKDLIYDARSVFSASGEPIKTSCRILRRSHSRAISTNDSHSLWPQDKLVDILKDMVTTSSKQSKGGFCSPNLWFAEGCSKYDSGRGEDLPTSEDSYDQNCYIAKNKSISAEEVADDPQVEKVVKKAAAKMRPDPAAEPVAKRKRTTVGRGAPTEKSLAIRVSGDEKSDEEEIVEQGTEKERTAVEQPTVEEIVEEIVAKVIAETTEIEIEEPTTVETESRIDVSAITNYDVVISFKVLSNEEGPLVETEKEKETEKETAGKWKKFENIIDSEDTEPLSKVLKLTETSLYDEESMSIEDILRQIPEEMMLPSVMTEEATKIRFYRGIAFREVNWYKASLPQIDTDAKGNEPVVEEIIKGNCQTSCTTQS
ncbi:zinc finger CCCH domain-containing protein 34-like [Dorcoceras hygrometricum]|uniref:Zinc finger CCCH domain-containing protein 34-like n=1 Tax=Dorcoceras hygrometricum TaxID=472368 RepID=A0A2Z7DCW4_9LAMI|nr:zinc finger CCCH domain-containing protein 34-like [Dorcoceras hygrometricum]